MKDNSYILWGIIILVFLLVGWCAYYLISNRAGENVLELSFTKLLIPVAVAFGLFFFDYLKPTIQSKKQLVFCLTDKPFTLTSLVSGIDGNFGDIYQGTMDITTFHARYDSILKTATPKDRLEQIDVLLIHLLHKRYSNHWSIDHEQNLPFFEMNASITAAKDTSRPYKFINTVELHSKFSSTHPIQNIDNGVEFCIPQNSTLSIKENDFEHSFLISNKYINLEIVVTQNSTATLPHSGGKTAKLIRDKLELPLDESYRLDFYGYTITIKSESSKFRKNHPETKEQLAWVNELSEYLESSYGWETVVNELKK